MRMIDVELLTTNIAQIAKYCARSDAQKALVGRILFMIENMPTIEAEPVNGWISVKDRLPEPKTWVMVYIEYPSPVFEIERGIQKMSSIKKMFYDGKSFYCGSGTITHWQPLPSTEGLNEA